jgi:hypothetical protein
MNTDEQKKYIYYKGNENTKLLACAGSGKTRCIISRMERLIKKKVYLSENIMMLTFTRFTKDDFINKIKSYGAKYIDEDCIRTIDSFSKSLIDPDNKIDVTLLSLRFMKFLENESLESLKTNVKLRKIKTIFVDESQDLNEIQYKIFLLMNEKLGTIINLIGDPNQNIYQFRGSSDKYLTEFPAKVFKLTKNFRSYKSIIDFSQKLQTYNNIEVQCQRGANDYKPIILFYNNEKSLEDRIIGILKNAIESNIDLCEFAILSPTRGRMRSYGKSHGLCLISNILHQNKIKFKQFYEESSEEVSGGQIKYQPEKDHINILTYMGSKGLEWNYVIVLDADLCLINKRFLDHEKHLQDRYLLYVACSRAIEHMFIISRYNGSYNNMKFKLNPWISEIPEDNYVIEDAFAGLLEFPKIENVNMGNSENKITKILSRMTEYKLDDIAKLSNYENKKINIYKKIYKNDYSHIKTGNSMFLGKFIERLFNVFCDIKYKRFRKEISEIKNIIDNTNKINIVIGNIPSNVFTWYNNHKFNKNNNYSWNDFDNDITLDVYIKNFINKRFDRNKDFCCHTLIQDEHFKNLILTCTSWIKNIYDKYIECTNYEKSIKLVFYITVILHSFDTQHYFHIQNKGSKFKHILSEYKELFSELKNYVLNIKYDFIDSNKIISKYGLVGEIDLIDHKNRIWEIKCVGEISLCNFIQVLTYNLIVKDIELHDKTKYTIRFINLLKGEIIHYTIKLTRESTKNIIDMLIQIGEIK